MRNQLRLLLNNVAHQTLFNLYSKRAVFLSYTAWTFLHGIKTKQSDTCEGSKPKFDEGIMQCNLARSVHRA